MTQFKNILSEMKSGYAILSKGYNAVRDVSQGNFSMHEVFLDGLLAVNPQVKKYRRVADIISYQGRIVSEYKKAFKVFRLSGNFSSTELDYLSRVYDKLFDQSMKGLDELALILTAGTLRMSDDERLEAIDRIFKDTEDKLQFLRHFNNQAKIISLQRAKEKGDTRTLQDLYQTEITNY
ncbi:hypothetical protein ADIARSV_0499 [Arcticibacter svalbardensis MN12-7]|uniref:TerB family tellurite resistance protein n=1 Tax=Arcticibacter svalbardensis MN12-7 TaxID=1150600 RepID=R9H519_9SPHI|nr:hypothetical protein ADIARSV_0499 [Arcticibacter svalbardensis MN12-7]